MAPIAALGPREKPRTSPAPKRMITTCSPLALAISASQASSSSRRPRIHSGRLPRCFSTGSPSGGRAVLIGGGGGGEAAGLAVGGPVCVWVSAASRRAWTGPMSKLPASPPATPASRVETTSKDSNSVSTTGPVKVRRPWRTRSSTDSMRWVTVAMSLSLRKPAAPLSEWAARNISAMISGPLRPCSTPSRRSLSVAMCLPASSRKPLTVSWSMPNSFMMAASGRWSGGRR